MEAFTLIAYAKHRNRIEKKPKTNNKAILLLVNSLFSGCSSSSPMLGSLLDGVDGCCRPLSVFEVWGSFTVPEGCEWSDEVATSIALSSSSSSEIVTVLFSSIRFYFIVSSVILSFTWASGESPLRTPFGCEQQLQVLNAISTNTEVNIKNKIQFTELSNFIFIHPYITNTASPLYYK